MGEKEKKKKKKKKKSELNGWGQEGWGISNDVHPEKGLPYQESWLEGVCEREVVGGWWPFA